MLVDLSRTQPLDRSDAWASVFELISAQRLHYEKYEFDQTPQGQGENSCKQSFVETENEPRALSRQVPACLKSSSGDTFSQC